MFWNLLLLNTLFLHERFCVNMAIHLCCNAPALNNLQNLDDDYLAGKVRFVAFWTLDSDFDPDIALMCVRVIYDRASIEIENQPCYLSKIVMNA